jgi:hypothetical protein
MEKKYISIFTDPTQPGSFTAGKITFLQMLVKKNSAARLRKLKQYYLYKKSG